MSAISISSPSTIFLTLPDALIINVFSFLKIEEELTTIDKACKLFHTLSSADLLWRPFTLTISDNISRANDTTALFPTYHIGKNRLSTFIICANLKLPYLTEMEIIGLCGDHSQMFPSDKILGTIDIEYADWSPQQHNHVQMLSSVCKRVMQKNDPSEIEITKSCLLDGAEACLLRRYDEVKRLFLAFVAPWPYKFNWIPFRISQNEKQITMREIVPPELHEFEEPLEPKEVICSTWKQVYKSAMQHFLKA